VVALAGSQSKTIETPAVKRRRLKAALRQDREAANLTQAEAAEDLYWSVSKIIRIEAGAVGVSITDLRALMDLYKVTNEKRQTELLELAHGSRRLPWSAYSNVYSSAARMLFDYEAAARTVYKYEPTFIPGLLQTEEYARALLKGVGHSDDEIESMVRGRLERQDLLDQEIRPQLEFIIGEAAVSRVVGNPGVMLHQLEHLKDLAARPENSLQILTFDAGAHPRMGEAFTILEFRDESLDDLLYLENAGRESVTQEDPERIAAYREDFITLKKLAHPASDFSAIIDRIEAARLAPPSNINTTKDGAPKQSS
jgi:transcriptional regulator with XRE-family HTH domain